MNQTIDFFSLQKMKERREDYREASLNKLKDRWEKGLHFVAGNDGENTVLRVLKNKQGQYYCYRYFLLDKEWHHSADYQAIADPEACLRWVFENV